MSEAASGNTSQPQDHSLSYRDRALILTAIAGLLWVAAAVAVIADVALRDEVPDPVPTGLLVLAATATIGAMVWWTRTVSAEAIGRLAAEVEQVSVKVDNYWRGYTDGVEDVNGKVINFPPAQRN